MMYLSENFERRLLANIDALRRSAGEMSGVAKWLRERYDSPGAVDDLVEAMGTLQDAYDKVLSGLSQLRRD